MPFNQNRNLVFLKISEVENIPITFFLKKNTQKLIDKMPGFLNNFGASL
jgi:hypothetical protein